MQKLISWERARCVAPPRLHGDTFAPALAISGSAKILLSPFPPPRASPQWQQVSAHFMPRVAYYRRETPPPDTHSISSASYNGAWSDCVATCRVISTGPDFVNTAHDALATPTDGKL